MHTIHSADHKTIIAENFDVLVDPKFRGDQPPVIGLMVEPHKAPSFILPMRYETAREVAETILRTLLAASPEMFTG